MKRSERFSVRCESGALHLTRRMIAAWFTIALCIVATSSAAAEILRVGGTGSALGPIEKVAHAFSRQFPDLHVEVLPSMGSGGGIRALVQRNIDLALSSRLLSEAEQREPLQLIEFSRTPFVFVVNPESPVESLELQDIVRIYRGERTFWPGGQRLRLILRPKEDSDTTILESMSSEVAEAATRARQQPGMIIAVTDQESADLAERSPGALATSTLAQVLTENRRLKILALNGVVPSAGALADGHYPYFKPLYLVTRANTSATVKAFVDFILSPDGRSVLDHYGCWVPQ